MNLNVKGESMTLWSRPSSDDAYGKLLKSMESSLKSTLDISKDTLNNSYTQSVLLNSIATGVREISLNVQNLSMSLTGSAEKLSSNFSRSLSLIRSLNNTMEDLLERTPEDSNPDPTNIVDPENNSKVPKKLDIAIGILNKLSSYAKTISEKTSEYHDYTSDLLRYTGSGLEAVREYRSELTQNIVGRLNDDVGEYFFNSTESYKTLTDIARSANIGNLEALEEISRPVLLAESALQTDVTRIAELFNKFYLRYNFSSLSMESMVDNILTYTANNQAQAASVTEGIYALSDEIAIYTGGDEGKINAYTDTLAKSLSWVESLGQDSATYTEDLNKIFSGAHYTDQGLRQILEMGGLNTVEAQELAKSGDFDTLIEALFTGRANWGKQIIDNPRFADLLPVYGLSEDELENAYGAYLSPNYQSMSQFEPEGRYEAVETLRDHFVSWEDQFGNWASKWTDWATRIEEKLGISLGDIGTILGGIAGILGVAKFVKSGGTLLSALFGGAGASSGGILGGIGKILPALGVAGAVAGIGLAIYKMYDGFKNAGYIKEQAYESAVGDVYTEGVTSDTSYGFDSESGKIVETEDEYDSEKTKKDLYEYYKDLILTEPISNTGLTPIDPDASYGDMALDTLGNIGKFILGPGFFSGGKASWHHYIPIIGGITANAEAIGTSAQYNFGGGNKVYKDVSSVLDEIQNLSPERTKILKAYTDLYPDITGEQKTKRLAYFFDNEKKITEAYGTQTWDSLVQSGYMKGYATGTNYIPYDQIAYLHEGEAVVPKKYNPAANPTDLDSIRERTSNLQEVSSEYYKESISVLREVRSSLDELKEIREFLASWREDNITRETVKESVSRLNYQRATVSGYMPLQV